MPCASNRVLLSSRSNSAREEMATVSRPAGVSNIAALCPETVAATATARPERPRWKAAAFTGIIGTPFPPRRRSMTIPKTFKAFRIHSDKSGYRSGIERVSLDDLAPGEIVIRSAYSSVNFKDALAGTGEGRILRRFPLVGGIDVAGHVVASADAKFREGDAVLVTGSGLSETRDGGYSEYARLESRWAVALPAGLDRKSTRLNSSH